MVAKNKEQTKVASTKSIAKKTNLSSLTIKELKAKLDELGVDYKKSGQKNYFIELLENLESSNVSVKEKPKAEKSKTEKPVKESVVKSTKTVSEKKTEEKVSKVPLFKKSSKLASLNTFYTSLNAERSKVTVIMRDSKWLFTYWEFGGNLFNQCKNEIIATDGQLKTTTLRVINESGDYYDIDISYGASSFYFEPQINGCLKVEIGLKNSSGRFYSIAISNTIKIDDFQKTQHADEVLWMNDDKLVSVSKNEAVDTQVIIESLGGAKYIKKIIGSEEFLEVLKENLSSAVTSKFISKIVTSFVSSGISSEFTSENSSYHSNNTIKQSVLSAEGKDDDAFWLIANTELILYGATEPDAKLTVAGKNISLNEDGTFFLRMPLPDGDVDLPVEAYSSNGKHYRKINPQVKKWTK